MSPTTYLPPAGKALKITIPAMRRQFRIETRPQGSANVGTTVKVFVDGKKIPTDGENEPVKPLDVTAYLSVVAGFVEFPIVITEGDRKTILLHPKQDAEAARQRFGEAFKVHQLDLCYPWAEAIYPQDLRTAREVLKEERWDIASDLGLEGYDGVLTYLVPHDDVDAKSGGVSGSKFFTLGEDEPTLKIVRWNNDFSFYRGEAVGMSHSSKRSPTYAVYRDGVLLSTASAPEPSFRLHGIWRSLPVSRIVVNLPKTKSPRVDLARSKILGMHEHWDSPVHQAYQHHLFKISLKDLLALNLVERLYQLGCIIAFYNIKPESLLQVFPHESLPVPFIEAEGRINVLEWQEVTADALYVFPKIIKKYLSKLCRCKWLTHNEYDGPLSQWTGERCIIPGFEYRSDTSAVIEGAGVVWNLLVRKSHTFDAIRFLHPPWEGDPPLLQEILLKTEMPNERPEIEIVLERTIENPTLLNTVERETLHEILHKISSDFPRFVEFPHSFDRFFAYGNRMLNLKHPVTQALLRFGASLNLSKMSETIPEDRIGHLQDAIDKFLGEFHHRDSSDSLRRLWLLAQEVQLFDVGEIDDLVLTPEDFVPGTFDTNLLGFGVRERRVHGLPFGNVIQD